MSILTKNHPSANANWWETDWKGPAAGRGAASMPGVRREPVGLVGLFGAAGVSILTAQIDAAVDLGNLEIRGGRWPDPRRGDPRLVVAVTRTHGTGLARMRQALAAYTARRTPPGMHLAGALLVADAPDKLLHPDLGREITVLKKAIDVQQVPWIPAWQSWSPDRPDRLGEQPTAAAGKAVQAVQEFLDELRAAAAPLARQPNVHQAARPVETAAPPPAGPALPALPPVPSGPPSRSAGIAGAGPPQLPHHSRQPSGQRSARGS